MKLSPSPDVARVRNPLARAAAPCLIAGAALLPATHAAAAVLYDLDSAALDGAAGENTYFVRNSQASAGLSYNSAAPSLTWTQGGNYTYLAGYFDAATLADVGDAITLSYTITPSSASAFSTNGGALRIGLFDSGGERIDGDKSGTGDVKFYDYVGYMGLYRPNGSPTSTDTLYDRSDSPDNAILLSTTPATPIAGAPTLDSPGTGVIDGSLTLTRTGAGVEVRSTINGNTSQSVIDTAGAYTAFDTFGFMAFPGQSGSTLTFSELEVTFVPEPGAFVLAALGGAFVAGSRRRRAEAGR